MRILQVITSLRLGGAEHIVAELATRLPVFGLTVDVAVFDGVETPLKKQLEQQGCRIHSLGSGTYNPLYIFKLMRLMRNYDLVHSHNSSPQLFVAIANLFCRKKIVTTEHSPSNRRRGYKLFQWIDSWMYNRYDKVVCISEQSRKTLLEHIGTVNGEIMVVSNGVDINKFAEAKPHVHLRKEADSRFVVVMVAGFRAEKDQDTVIKALALLPHGQFELWLVGDGVRRAELQQLAKQRGVNDYMRFLGIRTDVAEVLHTADAVVMSSHYEGLSLSSVEGMSVGKPFIASDVMGLHEIVDGAGLLFPHQDDKALANILLKLASNEALCSEVATRCYDRAKMYDVQKMVRSYSQLYRGLLPNESVSVVS